MSESFAPSGRLDGRLHRYPIRVYIEDTDLGGIVYHSNYLRYAERARTEMLRLLGVSHAQMMETDGLFFAVRWCEMDFLRPARLDDEVEVRTRILKVGGASVLAEQVLARAADGLDLVRIQIKLAAMGRDLAPARLSAPLRALLTDFISQERD
ncbi:YbgC/FadM family acyl-CoA thioesterase [Telmatospirillum sp. J64-1]|uniref:YbgC/FadM family acyl-CoA thioesterase n=1 Tax=Telmatospirillum sp. J64-1 TaxID=2502183 RepID=UPI00115D640B|nr:YbgC/FadM family acyl-CoA thioesterase [Telmatospirillum sp. J64-1]